MNGGGSIGHAELDELVARLFHGAASDVERGRLAGMLGSSAAARERFLDHAAVFGSVIDEARAGGLASDRGAAFAALEELPEPAPRLVRRRWWPWVTAAAAAVLAGLLAVTAVLLPARASAALEQVIAAFDRPQDRVYSVVVLERGDQRPAVGGERERDDRGRFPPAAFLDGARLHLRGGTQFVLRQSLPGGETRLLGSDGRTSWTIRGAGPVRVSRDPTHFGGGLLAGRQEEAFLHLRAQLDELRRIYQLELFEPAGGGGAGVVVRGLRGVRRSAEHGGPKQVELWFDPASGLIHRLVLGGLPRGGGGPASVMLTLESTADLAPGFFGHGAHHEPGRPVEEEDGRRGVAPRGGNGEPPRAGPQRGARGGG